MKNLYQTAKEKVKKYAKPVAVATGLGVASYLSGSNANANELPIYNDVKEQIIVEQNKEDKQRYLENQAHLEKLVNSYDSTLNSARDQFNLSIKDGKLTIQEQEQIHESYNYANNLEKEIVDFSEKIGKEKYSKLEMSEKDSDLKSKLYHNLYGTDVGTPELELQLKNNGLKIEVESKISRENIILAFLGTLVGGIGGMALYRSIRGDINFRKRLKREKNKKWKTKHTDQE